MRDSDSQATFDYAARPLDAPGVAYLHIDQSRIKGTELILWTMGLVWLLITLVATSSTSRLEKPAAMKAST